MARLDLSAQQVSDLMWVEAKRIAEGGIYKKADAIAFAERMTTLANAMPDDNATALHVRITDEGIRIGETNNGP
jgi:hypothetical protein